MCEWYYKRELPAPAQNLLRRGVKCLLTGEVYNINDRVGFNSIFSDDDVPNVNLEDTECYAPVMTMHQIYDDDELPQTYDMKHDLYEVELMYEPSWNFDERDATESDYYNMDEEEHFDDVPFGLLPILSLLRMLFTVIGFCTRFFTSTKNFIFNEFFMEEQQLRNYYFVFYPEPLKTLPAYPAKWWFTNTR